MDRSHDQVKGAHGSRKYAVKYDEFHELLNSEVGSFVKVLF